MRCKDLTSLQPGDFTVPAPLTESLSLDLKCSLDDTPSIYIYLNMLLGFLYYAMELIIVVILIFSVALLYF